MEYFTASARANLHPSLYILRHSHGHNRSGRRTMVACSSDSNSYLDMWKKAMERERKAREFQNIPSSSEKPEENGTTTGGSDNDSSLRRKTEMFNKILGVSKEERDRVQRLQVIDRAAAAIEAARALVKTPPPISVRSDSSVSDRGREQGLKQDGSFKSEYEPLQLGTPGPDFWSWSPPQDTGESSIAGNLELKRMSSVLSRPSLSLMEKEKNLEILPIPFQSTLSQSEHTPPLPPLQSIIELENVDVLPSSTKQPDVDELFPTHAAEAAVALHMTDEATSYGVKPDGSKWWKETGIERRSDGVVCKWTLTRGVSANGAVEWEDKYWEASDQFDYKELGAEKSGRDAAGNIWHEYWKESMWQDLKSGLVHMEKSADKWGKNSVGGEWHEKWWEHYDASGQAEKWADKWCCVDPTTPLHAGHAHVWHERWGEKYDGKGGSMKYTDKWAERSEGDGWSKWGDKWDENFSVYGHGVKQGETWWEGKHGEQWNRTWGEKHNGSGWIHKYGKSSSGEHWDTHVQEETWYERYPHFGFDHCFQNSVQLRQVGNPPTVT